MLESSAQNSEKQTAKIHSPASIPSLAGPRPCTFYTKHTQNAKINSFPTSRMGVARGSGPHLQPGRLKKLSKLQFQIRQQYSDLFQNLLDTWVGGLGRTFRIVPNSLSFCLTEADLSLLSYHVLAYTTLNMLAGAQRYICAFFGRLLKSSLFGCSNRRKNEPHSFNTPFLLVFPFFSGLASPSSGIAALFRKFLLDSWLIIPTLPPAPNSRVSGRLQPSLCSSLPREVRYRFHDLPKEEIPRQG